MVCSLPSIITYAKFHVEIFRGNDFTGGRISHLAVDFCMGLTTVQRYCAACDIACPNRVRCMLMPKFHCIYLAQNLLKTRSPTCFEQVSDMSQTSQRLKKVGDLVSDKTDLSRHVEIDLATSFRQIKKSGTWSQTSQWQVFDKKSRRPGLRQDRSNGIWA